MVNQSANNKCDSTPMFTQKHGNTMRSAKNVTKELIKRFSPNEEPKYITNYGIAMKSQFCFTDTAANLPVSPIKLQSHKQRNSSKPRETHKWTQEIRSRRKNNSVHFGHEDWNIAVAMMIGIRVSLVGYKDAMPTELSTKDFTSREKVSILNQIKEVAQHSVAGKAVTVFYDYAGSVFHAIRRLDNISTFEYARSLGPEALIGNLILGHFSSFKELKSEGKSGAFFFTTPDGKYIIKTVTQKEKDFLEEILPHYYNHLIGNPNSLIVKFYGLHSIELEKQESSFLRLAFSSHKCTKLYFVVMAAIVPNSANLDWVYDLKGSWVGRSTMSDEKPAFTLKDIDFAARNERIPIDKDLKKSLMKYINTDAKFLASLGIMDYSLLLGVKKEVVGAFAGDCNTNITSSFKQKPYNIVRRFPLNMPVSNTFCNQFPRECYGPSYKLSHPWNNLLGHADIPVKYIDNNYTLNFTENSLSLPRNQVVQKKVQENVNCIRSNGVYNDHSNDSLLPPIIICNYEQRSFGTYYDNLLLNQNNCTEQVIYRSESPNRIFYNNYRENIPYKYYYKKSKHQTTHTPYPNMPDFDLNEYRSYSNYIRSCSREYIPEKNRKCLTGYRSYHSPQCYRTHYNSSKTDLQKRNPSLYCSFYSRSRNSKERNILEEFPYSYKNKTIENKFPASYLSEYSSNQHHKSRAHSENIHHHKTINRDLISTYSQVPERRSTNSYGFSHTSRNASFSSDQTKICYSSKYKYPTSHLHDISPVIDNKVLKRIDHSIPRCNSREQRSHRPVIKHINLHSYSDNDIYEWSTSDSSYEGRTYEPKYIIPHSKSHLRNMSMDTATEVSILCPSRRYLESPCRQHLSNHVNNPLYGKREMYKKFYPSFASDTKFTVGRHPIGNLRSNNNSQQYVNLSRANSNTNKKALDADITWHYETNYNHSGTLYLKERNEEEHPQVLYHKCPFLQTKESEPVRSSPDLVIRSLSHIKTLRKTPGDILTTYTLRKGVEHAIKKIVYESDGISCVPPDLYYNRFVNFIDSIFDPIEI